MTLLIDVGNSRTKWCLHDSQGFTVMHSVPHQEAEQRYQQWIALEPPSQIYLSASAPDRIDAIQQQCDRLWGAIPQLAKSAVSWRQLKSGYYDPSRLGIDRWLGMVAGWQRTQGAFCLIDCGTATTLDLVDHQGQHQGGLILPGLEKTMAQLLDQAPHLRTIQPVDAPDLLGRSTEEALRSAEEGVVPLLLKMVKTLQASYGPMKVWVTGGDGALLCEQLDSEGVWKPALILEGLWFSRT